MQAHSTLETDCSGTFPNFVTSRTFRAYLPRRIPGSKHMRIEGAIRNSYTASPSTPKLNLDFNDNYFISNGHHNTHSRRLYLLHRQENLHPTRNNPEVFTDLIRRLGVSSKLTFHDLYSLDLISLIPRPAHALIFIAPAPIYYAVRSKYDNYKDSAHITYNSCGPDKPVMWFKRTIGHACGLYSLIHAVGNGSAKEFIEKDSLLDRLLKEAEPLQRKERAEVLYSSHELEVAHMASAVQGDSRTPSSEEPVGYHFITFVKGDDGHLWELEGSWDPINRGVLDDGEDVLSDKVVELGIGKYMKVAEELQNAEMSIVVLSISEERNDEVEVVFRSAAVIFTGRYSSWKGIFLSRT